MNKLIENITNIHGQSGKQWIHHLPDIVNALAEYWQLSQITPVDNMTYNYVAKAVTHNQQPVILKISCDKISGDHEKEALLYFSGNASVKMLDHNEQYHAMLLEQAIPGISLKSLYPDQIDYVMDCYAATINKLHAKPLPHQHSYKHVREWLQAIDKVNSNHIPEDLINHAIQIKNELLSYTSLDVFLHGDLHHDNIIKNDNEWVTIDPKGIVGNAEFEVAAFDFIHASEFHRKSEMNNLYQSRINLLAKKTRLQPERIKKWVYVRLILSAVWSIEDNCDIGWDIELAKSLA